MGEVLFCRENFSEEQTHALTVCQLVVSILSLVGSSFMLENFFLYDKGRNPLTKLVAWLAFGDYMTAVVNIVKSIMLLHYPHLFTWDVCVGLRAWFQIVAGSTWCYTSVIAYFLYRFMVSRSTTWVSWPLWIGFHVASWGVPSIGVVVMVAGNFVYRSANTGLCYPTEPWHIILWFVPIIVSFAWMILCYTGIFYYVCCGTPKSKSKGGVHGTSTSTFTTADTESLQLVTPATDSLLKKKKKDTRRVQIRLVLRFSFYILVFFICWIFDVVTYAILFFNSHCNVYAFTFGYTLFRNLQGMLDCLVYGSTNLKIRRRFTHSILSAIVSLWELLLAPVLVLPASVAYLNKLLHPYLNRHSESNKNRSGGGGGLVDSSSATLAIGFDSINDDLMRDHQKHSRQKPHFAKKVPAHYFNGDMKKTKKTKEKENNKNKSPETWEQRKERKKREKALRASLCQVEEQDVDEKQRVRQTEREGRRRPIPSYYFNGEPSPQEAARRQQKKEDGGGGGGDDGGNEKVEVVVKTTAEEEEEMLAARMRDDKLPRESSFP